MKKETTWLTGVGNKNYHQYIISDLIFGVRKKLTVKKLSTKYLVLPEITLGEIGYNKVDNNFTVNHNIDFLIIEKITGKIVFIAEIEREGVNISKTKKKIEQCVKSISSIEEAFIIKFSGQATYFEKCSLINKKVSWTEVSSRSSFLGLNIKSLFTSLKV